MEVSSLRLKGLKLISPRVFRDERGFFLESYRGPSYGGIETSFVQDNLSFSRKGTIRGLHFQSEPGQAKLISCLQGKVWDVAVDIRLESPTYGEWEAVELDEDSHRQLFLPVGFAHGFCVLSETALVHYKVSAPYCAEKEKSIRWNDPKISITWPVKDPVLSLRDATSPLFEEAFV